MPIYWWSRCDRNTITTHSFFVFQSLSYLILVKVNIQINHFVNLYIVLNTDCYRSFINSLKKKKHIYDYVQICLFLSHNGAFQTVSIDKRKLVQAFCISLLLHTILSDNCYFRVYNSLLSKAKYVRSNILPLML